MEHNNSEGQPILIQENNNNEDAPHFGAPNAALQPTNLNTYGNSKQFYKYFPQTQDEKIEFLMNLVVGQGYEGRFEHDHDNLTSWIEKLQDMFYAVDNILRGKMVLDED